MTNSLQATISSLAPATSHPPLLKDSRVELAGGEITCLIGPSGAGKTVLLRLLAGDKTIQADAHIRYRSNGEALNVRDAATRGWLGLFLPDTGLPPWQKVADILSLPARFNPRLQKPDGQRVTATLQLLQLPSSTLKKIPRELSLGMRHRVLLALAVLYEPRFLFVDELLSSIDSPTVDGIVPLLKQLVTEREMVCLLTTHDLDRAMRLGTTFYFKGLDTSISRLSDPTKADMLALFEAQSKSR